MIRTSPYKIALAASILAGTIAHAQSEGAPNQTTRGESLDTLEAIGQIEYQTGDVLNEDDTLSSARINREQLSRTPTALAEVVSRETGVQYKQSGGFGSYATVSIRAASAAQTGVYLDGILLNSGGNPVIDLSTLEILNLGSVDVYRGGTPSQLGHGGIGGAVNLKTLRPDNNDTANRIRLEYGSLSQAGAQASHQASKGKWDWLVAASQRQSENDFTYLNINGTPLEPNDDQVQKRENAHALRTSALLRAGFQHSFDRRTDVTLQLANRVLGVPEWRNRLNNQSSYDSDTSQLQLSHIIDGIGGWNSRQVVYRHTGENHFTDPQGLIGVSIEKDTLNQLRTEGAKSYWEYPIDSGTLGLSVEYRQETLHSDERLDNIDTDYDADRNKWLAIANYTWYSPSEAFTISPTIQWQRNQFRGSRRVGSVAIENERNTSEWQAQLGLGFQVSNNVSVSANFGNYYRPPSFGELYGSIGLITGNPELLPEQGINADVGIALKRNTLQIEGSVFVSRRDQLIVTSFDSRGVGKPVNSGAAEVFGLELGASWTVLPKFTLRSNLTWQSPKSVNRSSGLYGTYLPGEAQFAWFGRAEYLLNAWTIWYAIDAQTRRFYDQSNILPAADSTVHSAGLGWKNTHWQFSVSANNLSDQIVEDFNGFPKPGRTLSILTTYLF